jgi:hypothetical protein
LPFISYVALRVVEDIDDVIGDLRGLLLRREDLIAQRKALVDEFKKPIG